MPRYDPVSLRKPRLSLRFTAQRSDTGIFHYLWKSTRETYPWQWRKDSSAADLPPLSVTSTTAAIFWALPVKITSIYWLLRAIKTEDKRKRGHLKSTWGRTVEAELQACKGPTQLTLVDALCANWRLFKGTDNYTFNLLHYRKIFQQKIMFEWVDINVFFFNFSGWHHQVINLVSLMKFALSEFGKYN